MAVLSKKGGHKKKFEKIKNFLLKLATVQNSIKILQ